MKSKRISPIVLTAIMVFFLVVMPVSAQWGTPTRLTYIAASDVQPSISGDGSKIAFLSDRDGDAEIFVINSDGTDLSQLTHNTVTDGGCSFSSDGSKIAFHSDRDGDNEIFVINSDGTGLAQLTFHTASDMWPSISGDGSKITFMSDVDGDNEIFVINSDGTGLAQLTSNMALYDRDPSISDDGNKIAFSSNVDGEQSIFVVSYTSTPTTPYVVSSDDTGTERNTFDLTQDVYCYAGNLPTGAVDIYVVANKDVWNDNAVLSDVSSGYETETTETDGRIANTKIWNATLTQGDYDIVVDTNQNGKWNTGEPIDSEVDVGLLAVPEFTTIAIPVAAVLGLVFLMSRRSRHSKRRN